MHECAPGFILILGAEIESCMSTRLLREMNYATVTDGLIIFILRRKVSLLDLHFSLQGASPLGNRRKVISHRLSFIVVN